jgi:hypothetical protein
MFTLKKIFSSTSRPISIKLGTNHRLVKAILNCSNTGPGSLQRGDNYKNAGANPRDRWKVKPRA